MSNYKYDFTASTSDVSRDKWTSPQYYPATAGGWPSWNAGYFGRTGIRNPYTVYNSITKGTAVPINANSEAELYLGLFNPWANPSGTSYLGSEIDTRSTFAATGTTKLTVTANVKFPKSVPGGAVMAFFLYGLRDVGLESGSPCSAGGCRDEVDFEFSTNHMYKTGGTSAKDKDKFQVNTNVYLADSTAEVGEKVVTMDTNPINFDEVNELKIVIDYTGGTIEWFINGTSVRTYTGNLPHLGMQVRLNFWVPDHNWGWAYNSAFPSAVGIAGTSNANFYNYVYKVKDLAITLG